MSSIRRSDPEYQNAMREAKELFDAAMARSSTKGRVGRPKATPVIPAASAPIAADEIVELAEIDDTAEIAEIVEIADLAELDDTVVSKAAADSDEGTDPIGHIRENDEKRPHAGAARRPRRRAGDV